ncbi:MAG: triple tyrosine motif-containing protein [Cyclonatronaceae bacterium]
MAKITLMCLTLLICFQQSATAQISYQVNNLTFSEPRAGNQNWDIASDGTRRILIANNYGLLVLENAGVRLLELPERTIFRSVAYINGRIFTGSFEDFGYWLQDEAGELHYTSLVSGLENADMNNDEIWKIVEHQNKIYFHSFGSIYCYDYEHEKVYRLDSDGSYMFLHRAGGHVYTQKVGGSLYRLHNDRFVPVPGSDFFHVVEIKSIIDLPDGNILIATTGGIYSYDGDEFSVWQASGIDEVIINKINTMVLNGDKIIIGTILNGLYIYALNGEFVINMNTSNELQNNTILSLASDPLNNLWVGMDKGLDYIAFDTPINTYRNPALGTGSVYTAALYRDELYIGTNQGIYWLKRNSDGYFHDKTLIPNSQGQVWFIKEIDGLLYSGLNDGTYQIQNKRLRKISSVDGGYNLKNYQHGEEQFLLQSTYSDLVVYRRNFADWEMAYTLSGFSTPARFLEIDYTGNIWLGHSVKGIFQLQPDINFEEITRSRRMGPDQGLHRSSNRVFKLDNRIIVPSVDTLYQWDSINEQFIPFTDLDDHFTDKGSVRNIISAGNQRYWIIKQNEISLFEIHFNSVRLIYRMLPEMYGFELMEGYENIIPLSDEQHLICLDDGFAILDLSRLNRPKQTQPLVKIQSVVAINNFGSGTRIETKDSSHVLLPYSRNTINVSWSSTQIVGNRTYFQYRLLSIEEGWSSWTATTSVSYPRLPPGEYSFVLRSITPDGQLTPTESFIFVIKNPWYLSTWAYIVYTLVIISFILTARLYLSRKRWKARGRELELEREKMLVEKELAEKEIIKLTNEKLQTEVEYKSSQLATNTMAIMRKNDLLNSIKQELMKQKQELGDRLPKKYITQLTSLIDRGLQDEHEWEVFEQLYDQAHGDFFKRLKKEYSQLTPSDLRLCAYLRMNLSSKEIAPLLSISIRGVEERRYRLRKRLNLSTDTNLTELIMTF